MKFTSLTFLGLFVTASLTSVDAKRGDKMNMEEQKDDNTFTHRVLKDSKKTKKSKSGSIKDESGSCATCSEQLPGYSFFGQNYLEKNFWENLVEKIIDEDSDALPSEDEVDFGKDFLIPSPFFDFPTGVTCYENGLSLIVCGLTSALAELLYSNDLFRCILTSLISTARDITCQEDSARRRLNGGTGESVTGFTNQEMILQLPSVLGWTKFEDIVNFFGVDMSTLMGSDFEIPSDVTRRLSPDIRGSGDNIEDFVTPLDEALDILYRDSDNVQALRGNLFVAQCLDGDQDFFSLSLCAGLFSLVKALDASVCYYRTELKCGQASCTKDLAFDVAYNTERLVLDLPPSTTLQGDVLIADILSPCDACILEKSDGCAAFCPLFESYHTCDNVNAALEQVRKDPFGRDDGELVTFITDLLPI